MRTINWGIIGLGKIAHNFATDLKLVSGSRLYAVASRSQEKAEEFGTVYSAKKRYSDYEQLAQDPEVDIIYIATPHSRHHEDTLLCLRNKKAVLCEKPFAMNAQQVDEMISSAKENNCLLMEAMWTRIMPHFNFVLDEINSETYGKVKSIAADFSFDATANKKGRLFDKALGGGALLDVGIYPVFCALAILGEPEKIAAKTKLNKDSIDLETEATLAFANNKKAHIHCAIHRKTPTTATIICEHGVIYIESRFHESGRVTTIKEGVREEHDFGYEGRGYNFEASHMANLLREGKTESPMMTHDFSRMLIATLDRIREEIGLSYD